jgi:hypothetical protein
MSYNIAYHTVFPSSAMYGGHAAPIMYRWSPQVDLSARGQILLGAIVFPRRPADHIKNLLPCRSCLFRSGRFPNLCLNGSSRSSGAAAGMTNAQRIELPACFSRRSNRKTRSDNRELREIGVLGMDRGCSRARG